VSENKHSRVNFKKWFLLFYSNYYLGYDPVRHVSEVLVLNFNKSSPSEKMASTDHLTNADKK